jgi:hypothetical protein
MPKVFGTKIVIHAGSLGGRKRRCEFTDKSDVLYKSLSRNMGHQITALQLSDLPPIEVPMFRNEASHRFLHSIQRFELSFLVGTSQKLYIDFRESYLHFLSKLGLFFFNHLHSVLEFVLKGKMNNPIGSERFQQISLGGLSMRQMQLLKHVHLKWIIISSELVEFLRHRSTTLESISLHECRAHGRTVLLSWNGPINTLPESGNQWRVLFKAISNIKPSRLRRFTVTPTVLLPDLKGDNYRGRFQH